MNIFEISNVFIQVFTYSTTISNNLPYLQMYYNSCFMRYVGIIKATQVVCLVL